VTLRGVVDNLRAQRAAVQDARATSGVARVVNRIRVRSASSRGEEIVASIRAALARDPHLHRYEISVAAHERTVYLSGGVDTFFEKMRADQIAAEANGVKHVRNNLVVLDERSPLLYEPRAHEFSALDYPWYTRRSAPARSDEEIKQEIADELFWSPFVDAEDVAVRVAAGVATLRGNVNSYAEMRSAVANAHEGGAVRVDNQLRIVP